MDKRKQNIKNSKTLKNGNTGITLIALVISIIVMLILAGVSLNATIGENGIITKAQEANMRVGMAALEEYLQEKYVENFDEVENTDSKVLGLMKIYPEYFYSPAKDNLVNINTPYVTVLLGEEQMPYAVYLINKDGLPKEISDGLVGGNAGGKTYTDYTELNDVYGVTSDLKVFYSRGISNYNVDGYGFDLASIDRDNPARIIYDNISNGMAQNLSIYDSNGDSKLTLSEIKGIKSVTIDNTITNLNDIYNLLSLETLYIDNANLNSLNGIENCPKLYYIFIKNSTINDYSAIGKLKEKLKYLYIVKATNVEVEKLGNGLKGRDLPNLQYFGIMGAYKDNQLDSDITSIYDLDTSHNNALTDISPLENFSSVTKKAIKYLFLNDNAITNVEALIDFTNVYVLRLAGNNITNLKGLEKMASLRFLGVGNNKLTDNSIKNNDLSDAIYALKDLNNLYSVHLNSNKNLIWIDYLKNNTGIKILYLDKNNFLNHEEVGNIANLIRSCSSYTLDSQYSLDIMDVNETSFIDLNHQTISESQFLNLKKYTKTTKVNFTNLKIVKDNTEATLSETELNNLLNSVIPFLINLKGLSLNGIKFSDLSCISNLSNLRELDIRNTNVTTLQLDANDKIISGIKSDKLSNITYEYDSQSRLVVAKTLNDNGEYDNVYNIEYTIDEETGITNKKIKLNYSYKYYNCLNVINQLKLGVLGINNAKDNLTNIQKAIDYLYTNPSNSSTGSFYDQNNVSGLICHNSDALKTLEDCTEISGLRINCHGQPCRVEGILDLSKCEKLEKIYFCCINATKIVIPANTKEIVLYYNVSKLDFVANSKLNYIQMGVYGYGGDTLENMVGKCSNIEEISMDSQALNSMTSFNALNSFSSLKTLTFYGQSWKNIEDINCEIINRLNEFTNNNISTFEIDRLQLKNLDGLNNLTGLKTLYINNTYVSSISGIANLINLEKLTISNSKINDVSSLENLVKLTSLTLNNNFISTGLFGLLKLTNLIDLNLNNNSISNIDTYKDGNNDVTYKTLSIFATLNKTGKLKTLKIKNNYFSNYTELNGTTLEVTK